MEIQGAHARSSRLRVVGAITLSHALQHMYGVVLPLTYPFMIAELHLPYASLGLMLGLSGLAGGVLPAAAGLYQRLAPRRVLAAQNLALAATSILMGVAPGALVFGASRVAGAVAGSPQHPVGSAMLARSFPAQRSSALSWHETGANTGALVVPLLTAAALSLVGWRSTLLLMAVPLVLGTGIISILLRRPQGRRVANDRSAGNWRALWRRPPFLIILVGFLAAGGRGADVITPYLPAYLQSGRGLSPVMVSLIFTVVLAGSVLGPPIAGYLADGLERGAVTVAVYAAGALALAALAAAGANLPLLALLGILVGVSCYAEAPLLQALFADEIETDSPQPAFGVYFAISYGGGSLWLLALGTIIDHWGFAAAFWAMALSFLVAGLLLASVRARRSQPLHDA